MGEKVFYTGEGLHKVVHGQQGEVTGPGTGDNVDKRVAVRFPSNTGSIECPLNKVRRLRAAPAANPPRACMRPPRTRRCPRPVRSPDSLCRGAPALTARAAARTAAHCPGA